jgi:phosphoribosylamine--glycine ligase
MKVLIVGSGGREHALAWKCAQSPRVSEVLVAPGNGGTATEPRVRNVNVAAEDVAGLVALAKAEKVGLTIIGPEGPLVIGVVDAFAAAGLRCFGPRQAAAQLEGSKAFTKEFLKRHGIPRRLTPRSPARPSTRLGSTAAHAYCRQGVRPCGRKGCGDRRHGG